MLTGNYQKTLMYISIVCKNVLMQSSF